MKHFLSSLVIILVTCLVALSFQSCNKEETYTVWTDCFLYSNLNDQNQVLEDGHYIKSEITQADWANFVSTQPSEHKHEWTQQNIKDWFISCGFSASVASKQSTWFTTINHGILFTRTGNYVSVMIK